MRNTAILLMIIVCGMAWAIQVPLRAAAFSYTQHLTASSANLSWLTPLERTMSDGFVGDERYAKPYDKRSVRGVISLLGRRTSEMLNGCAAGGTSPMYTAWAVSQSPRTLRLSRGFTYSPSPMVSACDTPNGFISSD